MREANLSLEKREYPRISIKIPVQYRLEEDPNVLQTIRRWRKAKKNAYTMDMSMGGMNIVVDQSLQVGEILCFEVYLLDKKNVVTVYAEVKWTNDSCTGLRFLMMKDEDREDLKAFLEKSSPD